MDAENSKLPEPEQSRTPLLEVFRNTAGQYHVRLVGSNGETVLLSEAYTRRSDAVRAAETVQRIVPQADVTVLPDDASVPDRAQLDD